MRTHVLRKITLSLVIAVWLSMLVTGCAHLPGVKPAGPAKELGPVSRGQELEMSRAILGYFEERLYTLSGPAQAHLATRFYRVTGDPKYIHSIVFDLLAHTDQLLRDITHLQDPEHLERRYNLYYDSLSEKTESRRSRKEFLDPWKRELYDNSLVYSMYKWKQYGLAETRYQKYYSLALDYLRSEKLERFYLNHDVIRNDPVQAVNAVHYMYFLGVADLRGQLRQAFTEIYLGKPNALSKTKYQSMVYGLTHFIIAGSNYYQQFCSAEEYSWVLEFFRKNTDEIVTQCSADVIAEVGLCFTLCQVPRAEIPSQISAALARAFDKKTGYVSRTYHDLDSLEHRNIVAYLYLTDLDRLYPGPDISQQKKFVNLLEIPIDEIEGIGD